MEVNPRKKTTKLTKKKRKAPKRKIKGGGGQTVKGKFCSPKYANNNYDSCYDLESLVDIAKTFNQYYPNEEIDLKKYGKTFKKLWNEVDSRFKKRGCLSEECWAKNIKDTNSEKKPTSVN